MRKYILIFEENEEGTLFSTSNAVGFTGIEVLGLLSTKMYDIKKQLMGFEFPAIKHKKNIVRSIKEAREFIKTATKDKKRLEQ